MSSQKIKLALFLAVMSPSVLASGFSLIEQSASGQGLSYAGAAANAEDASVMWFNPAGLSHLDGHQVIIAQHVIVPKAAYTDSGSSTAAPSFIDGENDNGATVGIVPNLYWKGSFGGHDLGLGINVPFGQHISYDEDWVGRYHATETNLRTLNINPAVSKQITDQFSFGFGLNAQYVDLVLENKIDNRYAGGSTDGSAKLTADSWAFGYNFGLIYQPVATTDLGFSYRSSITHNAKGKVDYTDVVNTPTTVLEHVIDANASSTVSLPASASFSLNQQINPRLQFLADATWTKWSDYKELIIQFDSDQADLNTRQNFKDSWRLALGGAYQLNEMFKLRGGVAFDQTPISNPTNRSPRTPDADRKWISAGLGYKINKSMNLDFAYSYLMADKAKVNYTTNDAQYLKGSYDLDINIFSAQFIWKY